MDETDIRLLALLKRDGRAALANLAAAMGLTRATVRARLSRLEQSGEVQGYTVVTRADITDHPVRGLMMLGVEARATDRVMGRLAGLPMVRAVHSTNGRWDLIVELGTGTLTEFDDALALIRRMEGVTASETSLLLSTRRAGRL
jgi:DNA-binding Lrp family transcriptional regulator